MNDEILDNLNEQQLRAVKTTEGYVRVIAGAGSGKTKALTSRFAYIVNRLGINSSNILCVTFTNKAAQEMKKRVKAIIGDTFDVSLIATVSIRQTTYKEVFFRAYELGVNFPISAMV